jgi:ribonuclease HII
VYVRFGIKDDTNDGLPTQLIMLRHPECSGEAAVDEAGRGCLAFEVCAAAVVLPFGGDAPELREIKDSKKLSEKRRERLAAFIKEYAVAYGIGTASPKEIDELNILHATHRAMHRALDAAIIGASVKSVRVNNIVVDGSQFEAYFPPTHVKNYNSSRDRGKENEEEEEEESEEAAWIPHACVEQGDASRLNIAAASILAKTHRDALVRAHCERDPTLDLKYGFLSNKAYGSARHMKGLVEHGVTEHHRTSYAPVKRQMEAVKY